MSRADRVRRIVVAGTAGGVGTTTVAALLAHHLGSVSLFDHTGGGLLARAGLEGITPDPARELLDLGAHALDGAVLRDPDVVPLVVTAATANGVELGAQVVRGLAREQPRLLVCVEAFGRHDVAAPLRALRSELNRGGVTVIARDRALSPGGPIPFSRVSPRVRDEIERLARRVERY